MDPQVYLLFFITVAASVPNGAVGSFQSIIIKGFGYTDLQTALLQIPQGLVSVSSVLLATWSAGRWNARGLNIIFWSAIGGLLGGGLLAFLPADAKNGRLAGNYITHVVGAFLPCAYSFAACNFAVSFLSFSRVASSVLKYVQGHTKKVTINAIILIGL